MILASWPNSPISSIVMYAGRAVECRADPQLYARPQHPYTWGLFASAPQLTGHGHGGCPRSRARRRRCCIFLPAVNLDRDVPTPKFGARRNRSSRDTWRPPITLTGVGWRLRSRARFGRTGARDKGGGAVRDVLLRVEELEHYFPVRRERCRE